MSLSYALNFISQYTPKPSAKPKLKTLPPLPEHIARVPNKCFCPRCEPRLYELSKHPRDIWGSSLLSTPLHLWSHDVFLLAKQAADSFSHNSPRLLKFGQHHAQAMWKQFWLHSPEYELIKITDDLSTLDPAQLLNKPLEVFNQLFFLGQLPFRFIHLSWRSDREHARGCTECHENMTYIYLNPHHPSHINNPTGLLRTLLHEMVHAFLLRYGCDPRYQNCGLDACQTLAHQNIGSTGHGRAWHYLAKSIEDAGQNLLPGFKIWLGRNEVAMFEIERGGWRPGEHDLRDLFERYAVWLRIWVEAGGRDDDFVMREVLKRRVFRGMVGADGWEVVVTDGSHLRGALRRGSGSGGGRRSRRQSR